MSAPPAHIGFARDENQCATTTKATSAENIANEATFFSLLKAHFAGQSAMPGRQENFTKLKKKNKQTVRKYNIEPKVQL